MRSVVARNPVSARGRVMTGTPMPAHGYAATTGLVVRDVREALQPLQAAVEDVDIGTAANAVHATAAGELPERPVVPGATEGCRRTRVARTPEAVVPERAGPVHRVRPELVVAVDHRPAPGESCHGVQPSAGPGNQVRRTQAAGGLEVEGRREVASAVRPAGDVHEPARLGDSRVQVPARAGEVVGPA